MLKVDSCMKIFYFFFKEMIRVMIEFWKKVGTYLGNAFWWEQRLLKLNCVLPVCLHTHSMPILCGQVHQYES